MLALEPNPSLPSKIAKSCGFNNAHVSRALAELRGRRLVQRLTEAPKGRIYMLTKSGRKVLSDGRAMKLLR